jgi:hypothetical protein
VSDSPRFDQLNAREAARLIVKRERLGLEPLPLDWPTLRFTLVELLDEIDNLAIEELANERWPRLHKLAGRSLEDAARELGIDLELDPEP